MKLRTFLTFLVAGAFLFSDAQKPAITLDALKEWHSVGLEETSMNGAFVSYEIAGKNRRLLVVSTSGKWYVDLGNVSSVGFSADGRFFFYVTAKDSLKRLRTGSDSADFLDTGHSVKLFRDGDREWIAYLRNDHKDSLTIVDIKNGGRLSYVEPEEYIPIPGGSALLLRQIEFRDSSIHLRIVDLKAGSINEIWSGNRDELPVDFAFDGHFDQMAFIVERRLNRGKRCEIWNYDREHQRARLFLSNDDVSQYKNLQLASSQLFFRNNGEQLYFGLSPTERWPRAESAVKMEIWSYLDPQLKSVEERWNNRNNTFYCVVNLRTRRIVRVQDQDESIIDTAGNFALVKHWLGFEGILEGSWNGLAREYTVLVSTRDGARRELNIHAGDKPVSAGLSANGRWVVYFDYSKGYYYSYETSTGITRNMTRSVRSTWTVSENARIEPKLAWSPGLHTWLCNDRAVLIYDNFDIWQVDPSGSKSPLNLTNGYGIRHSIKFELAVDRMTLLQVSERQRGALLVRAFNKRNKQMGFYRIQLDVQKDPVICSMGPFVYGDWAGYGKAFSLPVKAPDAPIFITSRQSTGDAPNLFATKDFVNFIQLSNIQPQKQFNWLTSELRRWKTFDGSYSTGILYKPENFDSTKSYPVILDYYERRSDELNLYITPKPAADRINIAWFVSRGYLVFTPDIDYKRGQPGASALNSIASAAAYLARMHWVNKHKIGIQGHSFGGYETDYVITHTRMFAAACSASGFCDLVSWYLANARGSYGMFWSEQDQGRIMATLWAATDLYIRNSPVFRADRVTTPLLMMNNNSDRNVSVMQGVEFFSALRRLGHRVWMLDYEDQGHSIRGEAAVDYTMRLTQFFDHYLKDAPAPEWMTRPVPLAEKTGNPSFQLDPTIRTPGPGLNNVGTEIGR